MRCASAGAATAHSAEDASKTARSRRAAQAPDFSVFPNFKLPPNDFEKIFPKVACHDGTPLS
jgi:hypothetical protein